MADNGPVFGKPDVFGIMLSSIFVGCGRAFLIDNESTLKVDSHRAWREDGAVDGG